MDTLQLNNVSFQGAVNQRGHSNALYERVPGFSATFEFAKLYALQAPVGAGAWALSWIIAGSLVPTSGAVQLNGDVISHRMLRTLSWRVRFDEIKRFGVMRQTVAQQVRCGLRRTGISEAAVKQHFFLTAARYSRYLHQLSAEGWRASCAIGFANGRRIFCFPHIGHQRHALFREYRDLWLGEMLDVLKSSGALIVVPLSDLDGIEDLFDAVLWIE